jgi:hypothetical protein
MAEALEARRLWGAIKLGKETVKLMIQEGMTPLLPSVYAAVAEAYLAVGDRGSAVMYGEMALEILKTLGFLPPGDGADWDLETILDALSGS